MANVGAAVNYVLHQEDESFAGVITTASDGKRTRWGIDEHFHPSLTASTFYTTMGAQPALILATAIYETEYCPPLCIAEIGDQAIANKVLSLGVNMGISEASKLLQGCLLVNSDGHIGPITLDKLERATLKPNGAQEVLDQLREGAELFYRELVARKPQYQPDLNGWINRARA